MFVLSKIAESAIITCGVEMWEPGSCLLPGTSSVQLFKAFPSFELEKLPQSLFFPYDHSN